MTNEERLIKVYQEAQQRLIKLIALKEARGSVTRYQEELLRQVTNILRQLQAYSARWVQEAINEAYSQGGEDAVRALMAMGVVTQGYDAFARLHKASIEVLVNNTQSMLFSGIRHVGREIEDVVRQAGLDATAQKQATGATVKEAAKLVKQRLVQEGITAITDKRGRKISLDAYAETVARTTSREAASTALMNQLEYDGYDLVQMSWHNSSCPVCSVYEGRVYSISGRDPRYPALSVAFSSGYAIIHPRCKHVLTPYIPALADNPERDRAFSNRPFSMDTVSSKAIEAYNQRQAEQRKIRNDRLQFQRYKLVLGDDAPKTFAGFRRMKSANSERWVELQSDYRDAMKDGS